MGQRQQLFVVTKDRENKRFDIGFHNQWCYGKTSIQQFRNIIEFNVNADKYSKLSNNDNLLSENEKLNIVKSLWGVNAKKGYYHNLISLNDELKDWSDALRLDCQDNNDGICIIDFTSDKKPLICYVFPFDNTIYDDKDKVRKVIKAWQPINLSEYLDCYYSKDEIETTLAGDDKDDIKFFKQVLADIKYIERHTKYMTQEHLFKLYPYLNE